MRDKFKCDGCKYYMSTSEPCPVVSSTDDPCGQFVELPCVEGEEPKTLRDEFAMVAMGYMGAAMPKPVSPGSKLAAVCYEIADEMMKARGG